MRSNLTLSMLAGCLAISFSAHAQGRPLPPGLGPMQPPVANACAYLDLQTATSLHGGPLIGTGDAASIAGVATCQYADSKDRDSVALLIHTLRKGMEDGPWNSVTTDNARAHVTPVSGMGDRAAFVVDSQSVVLAVQFHGKQISLGVNGPDSPARRTAMTAVVRQMMGKL
jgi:hypothetical protein